MSRLLPLQGERDQLFQGSIFPKRFQFNAAVADVFDDMISRSVPLYGEVQEACVHWTKRYLVPGCRVYDLGCSTGTTLALMAEDFSPATHFVGVDTSEPMLAKAKLKLSRYQHKHRIDLECADAGTFKMESACVVIANYVLQFIPVKQRLEFLSHVYESLVPGGLLFISEKLRMTQPDFQEVATEFYELFKEANGYSRTEIERKKEALDQVLVALTYDEQTDHLAQAGFKQPELIMRWHSFATFVAKKPLIHE